MNPIYKEYCEFFKSKTGVELKEGYFWLDNSIVKCFDKQGNIHKLYKIVIDDDLNIKLKIPNYRNCGYSDLDNIELESWNETVLRHKERLDILEQESLKLIEEKLKKYEDRTPIILTSGGKDSSVCMHLVRTVNDQVHGIFNNTTMDCADTYIHIKQIENTEILNPDIGFYNWIKDYNIIPTRFSRSCCKEFKEGAMKKLNKEEKYLFFMGMRNEESKTREHYKDEWQNDKWGLVQWRAILPIRKWSELDIWLYILYRNIETNPKYRKGYSRAGCHCTCPYYKKSTWVLDKYFYPKMYNRWHKILEQYFIDNSKWVNMNCTLKEYHHFWNGGIVRDEPTEEVISEFMEYKDIQDRSIAEKYFNKTCYKCNKKVYKDEVALSMKYFGRQNEKMMCWKCLGAELNKTKSELKDDIEKFKSQGCTLF